MWCALCNSISKHLFRKKNDCLKWSKQTTKKTKNYLALYNELVAQFSDLICSYYCMRKHVAVEWCFLNAHTHRKRIVFCSLFGFFTHSFVVGVISNAVIAYLFISNFFLCFWTRVMQHKCNFSIQLKCEFQFNQIKTQFIIWEGKSSRHSLLLSVRRC